MQQTLCRYVIWRNRNFPNITYKSLSNELSAINHYQKCYFKGFDRKNMFTLNKIIRKIRLDQGKNGWFKGTAKHPIQRKHLFKILKVIPNDTINGCVLRTALCLARSAMLRCYEYCIDNGFHHSKQSILTFNDLKLISNTTMKININKSKCNPYWMEESTAVKCNCNKKFPCCPIHELRKLKFIHLQIYGIIDDKRPVFLLEDKKILSQQKFGRLLKKVLKLANIKFAHGSGPHMLRAGGACDLFLEGVHIDIIKKLGRWLSDSFLRYLKVDVTDFLKHT